mgnify:CR=1 FL=1
MRGDDAIDLFLNFTGHAKATYDREVLEDGMMRERGS